MSKASEDERLKSSEESLITSVLRSERKLLLLLSCMQFTQVLDFVIMMPLGPKLMRAFSIQPHAFSLLVSSYQFSASILGFFGAFILDRFSRKNSILVCYFGFIAGTFVCAVAPTYQILVIARIIAGAFGGLVGALVFAVIGDEIPESRRGTATGVVMASFSVASVVGVPLGLALADFFEWHTPFLLICVIGVIMLIGGWRWLPAMRGHLVAARRSAGSSPERSKVSAQFKEVREVLVSKNHWYAFGLTMTLMFGGFAIIPFIAPFMVYNVGLKEAQLPYVYLFGGLCTFFTSRYIGRLADRFGKLPVFTILALSSLVPILVMTHLTFTPLWTALVISSIFMILFSGRFVPAMAMVTSAVHREHRGSFMSMNSCFQQFAAGAATYLAGWVVEKTIEGRLMYFDRVGLIACGFTLLAILLARRLRTESEAPDQFVGQDF